MEVLTDSAEAYVKAAIYGQPGTGKTSMGVTAPDPLFLLSERQGYTHIKKAARRLGIAVPDVLMMKSLDDYRAVVRAFHGVRTEPFKVVETKTGKVLFERATWPQTLVVDSLTDACKLVDDEVKRDSPPRKASDGLDNVTERHWAALRDRCEKLIRTIRDLPVHVMFLCLADDRTVGEGDATERKVTPQLPMRALPGFLCSAVNVVGITTREITKERDENGDRKIIHAVRTVGPEAFMLKPCRPLRDVEAPNFSSWVRRIWLDELDPNAAAELEAAAQAFEAATKGAETVIEGPKNEESAEGAKAEGE